MNHKNTKRLLLSMGTIVLVSGLHAAGLTDQLTGRANRVPQALRGFTPIQFADNQGRTLTNAHSAPSQVKAPRMNEAGQDYPTLYGTVISSKPGTDGSSAQAKGMYTLTVDGTFSRLNTQGDASFGGAPMADGFYYAVNRTGTGKIYVDKFNTSTWKRSTHTNVTAVGLLASDVAYDPTSDMVYGCFYNDNANGYVFGKIDYSVRKRIAIKPLEMSYNAVMVDGEGQVYGIDMTGNLYKINKTDGEATLVGHTGIIPLYTSSATIDQSTGRCFWTVNPSDGNGYLYEVNTQTAETTLLTTFVNSDEVTGMYIPAPAPAAGAPAPVTGLTPTFSDGSLSGNVTFTLPKTTVSGEDLSGDTEYVLWVDGVEAARAQAAPGSSVSVPVETTASGRTSFVACAINDAGKSKPAITKIFIGNDTPKAPAPELTYANGAFIVSWQPVTATVNNGYMNPEQVTYTVTRFPDNVTVAQNISETSFTDPVAPTPGRMIAYKYEVKAEFAGNVGAAGTTPVYPLGEIATPWHEGFDSSESMNNFIIIDSNGDGVKWGYSGGMSSAYITNSSKPHDDWMISAAIRMEAGVTYKLTFEAMASFYPERLEVKMGKNPTPDAMTITLVEPVELQPDFSMNANVPEFTVEESGLYYIGWHAISDADCFYLYLDNISLTDDAVHQTDAIDPPYTQTFDESASLEQFTVIDSNNDGFIWNIDQGEARVVATANSDDWMIAPPMNLKAGYLYRVDILARTMGSQERIEIKAGKQPQVDAMTLDVLPLTNVTATEPTPLSAYFAPETDDVYYLGIHACSDSNCYALYVDNLSVSAPVSVLAPAEPLNVALAPAMDGALTAELSFTTPNLDASGNMISSLSYVEVSYQGEVVKRFENPAVNAALNCQVSVPATGNHTFTVVAANENGNGKPVDVTAYFGNSIPNVPTDVAMTEEGDSGKVTITWTAPQTDINGRTLNPADLTYILAEVINGQSLIMARDIKATTYTLQSVSPDAPQQFKAYAVFALNSVGMSQGIATPSTPVGKPYQLPYVESFPNGAPQTALQVTQIYPEVSWSTYVDNTTEVNSVDSDNGFLAMFGANMDAAGALQTAKISLANALNPEFTFYVYNLADQYPDNNRIQVQVLTDAGQVVPLDNFLISERFGEERGWSKVVVNMKEYAGTTVRVAIGCTVLGYSNILIDALKIEDTDPTGVTTIQNVDAICMVKDNCLSIMGCSGSAVTVSALNGQVVYTGTPSADLSLTLASGVYVVKVNSNFYKVMIP